MDSDLEIRHVSCRNDGGLLHEQIMRTQDTPDVEAAWRTLKWTLVVVLLTTALVVSALPWLAQKAIVPIATAFGGQ